MVFWGSEDGREYGGENGLGRTMKGYQPGELPYLSPWCRPRGECDNARPGPKFTRVRREKSLLVLNKILMEKMNLLQESKGADLPRQAEQIEEVMTLLDLTERWGFEISRGEAQDLMEEILDECLGGLEKCWWENGTPKPFSQNLIALAEKLGFNVERFSKITGTSIPTNRS
jgi:hypothetical protein